MSMGILHYGLVGGKPPCPPEADDASEPQGPSFGLASPEDELEAGRVLKEKDSIQEGWAKLKAKGLVLVRLK